MFNKARAILATRMLEWDEAKICWPNMPPVSGGNAPWVRFTVLADGDAVSFVTTPTDCTGLETGLVVVQVFTPSGTGDGEASRLADSIAAHFRYFSKDGLNCGNISKMAVGVDDGWFQINVTSRWHYDGTAVSP